MRLAIADPPYPPHVTDRADLAGGATRVVTRTRARRWYGDAAAATGPAPADFHPDAGRWDDPAAHRDLLEQLHADYDGWAIATAPDALDIYRPLPPGARVLVWVRPRAMPSGSRIRACWEPVIVYTPPERRARIRGAIVPDVLTCSPDRIGFPGAKPARWTRWVLDVLGYDQDVDELVDLFPGSGAVSAAATQGTLL